MLGKLKAKVYTLLRKSEKYTKTDMVYLAQGGFWLGLGNVISSLSTMLLAIAYANLLSPSDYGIYKYILSVVGILGIFTLPGINTAIIKSVAKELDGQVMAAFKTKIRWGFIGGLISILIASYYFYNGNTTLTIGFLIAGTFIPFVEALGIYNAILQGKKMFKLSSIYSFLLQISVTASMIAVAFLTKNIVLIIFTFFATNTLVKYLFLTITKNKVQLNKKLDKDAIKEGKHFSLINLIGIVAGQIDKILLWQFLGAVPLAIYSFSLAPVDQFKRVSRTIQVLAFPKLAIQDKQEIKKTLPKKILKFFAILLVIVILYIIISPYLFSLLFPQYMESVKYSQLYSLAILFYPQRLMGEALMAHAEKKVLYILNTIGPLFKIILMLILLPIYGIHGAIFALLIPSLLDLILLNYFFKRI